MEPGLFRLPEIVDLTDGGEPIIPPAQIVYSSGPRLCLAGERAYVVKGPQLEVVAAETVAHALAGLLELPVPEFALGRARNGELHFASRHIDGLRDVRPFISRHLPFLSQVVAFDVWLFNNDRNMGAFVMGGEGMIALDFEKSWAVRSHTPTVELPTMNHRTLWPRGELGQLMRDAEMPTEFLGRIESVSDEDIASAVSGVRALLPAYTWSDSTTFALAQRRNRIGTLTKEVWP
jgi:hypothetical protein